MSYLLLIILLQMYERKKQRYTISIRDPSRLGYDSIVIALHYSRNTSVTTICLCLLWALRCLMLLSTNFETSDCPLKRSSLSSLGRLFWMAFAYKTRNSLRDTVGIKDSTSLISLLVGVRNKKFLIGQGGMMDGFVVGVGKTRSLILEGWIDFSKGSPGARLFSIQKSSGWLCDPREGWESSRHLC